MGEEIGSLFYFKAPDHILRFAIFNTEQAKAYIRLGIIGSYNKKSYMRWRGKVYECTGTNARGDYKRAVVPDEWTYVP